jgi:alanine-synthesizing transaminase
MPTRQIPTSNCLNEVRYEIRGELYERALALEAQGRHILKLNIGNPAPFGFDAPAHLREAVRDNLERSEGYCHQKGLTIAREAIVRQARGRGAGNTDVDGVFLGNGVSELIDLAMRGLLNAGDEVLVPEPDYPLWTASVVLNGGRPVHYPCRAENGFVPDPDEVAALITPRTRALVLINPNNPTGAVYPRESIAALAAVAVRHRLVLMTDEIYDGILYGDAAFEPAARHAQETLCLSFGGLSKVHRACGYRIGWMTLSGELRRATEYRHALDLLAALRLCSNVAGQWAVPAAIEGADTISALVKPGGRLFETRRAAIDGCQASRFLRLVAPRGALYAFPAVDTAELGPFDDHAFALDLLEHEHVLIVPGSSFNLSARNHFRLTLLPEAPVMREVFERMERALLRRAETAGAKRQVA